ncbi:MAG TPA: hypothetical protein VFC19_00505 [Candidatus Limnocylindrales bacterium]|nr:hypothetical protein [Candidatus Limnocylindrales bacterium]
MLQLIQFDQRVGGLLVVCAIDASGDVQGPLQVDVGLLELAVLPLQYAEFG